MTEDLKEQIKTRTSAVTPKGFNHLVMNVRNMEESHHFWCNMLGFKQVGELLPPRHTMVMRFYSGVTDGSVHHHDFALVEVPDLPETADWAITGSHCAINHLAITYPDRESWLEQVKFMEDNDAIVQPLRVNHGMTHSVYMLDPNGYGVEVLYDLPEEVWRDDVNGALNYATIHPREEMYVDDTNYETNFWPDEEK